jgi:hypothetical protein
MRIKAGLKYYISPLITGRAAYLRVKAIAEILSLNRTEVVIA